MLSWFEEATDTTCSGQKGLESNDLPGASLGTLRSTEY